MSTDNAVRLDPALLDERGRADAAAVRSALAGVGRLGVAFSGGVDSAVLLALATCALGPERVVAVMGVSPSLADDEAVQARRVAAHIGARLVEVETHEGDNPLYRANAADRCYHCKDELFATISASVRDQHGLTHVAYGENADDALRPDRPGSQAATEHGVLRPLVSAGLDKERVRAIARAWQLPCADKPAAPCLASRIPHGEDVTPQKLRQVEVAETGLRHAGFTDGRVRHHGSIARIELLPEELPRACDPQVRADLLRAVRAAGFTYVTIDLAGIQSGAFTLQIIERPA